MLRNNLNNTSFLIILGLGFLPEAVYYYLPEGATYEVVPYHTPLFVSEKYIRRSPGNIICLGWSLGGKKSLHLFRKYPSKFKHLYLLNQSPRWQPKAILQEKKYLQRHSLSRYLSAYYNRCFQGSPEAREVFMKKEFFHHRRQLNRSLLLEQLDTLLDYQLDKYLPFEEKITFIHTRYDAVAPLSPLHHYCQQKQLRYHVLKKSMGHFPFHSQELWKYLRH